MATAVAPHVTAPVPEHDRMPLHGIDHVEFFVGNAAQAAYFYAHAFGFTETPTPGWRPARATASRTCSAGPHPVRAHRHADGGDEIAEHHTRHGDGVKDRAVGARRGTPTSTRGARGARRRAPRAEDEHGTVQLASWPRTATPLHLFVERNDYGGPFLPASSRAARRPPGRHAAVRSTTSSATSSWATWTSG